MTLLFRTYVVNKTTVGVARLDGWGGNNPFCFYTSCGQVAKASCWDMIFFVTSNEMSNTNIMESYF